MSNTTPTTPAAIATDSAAPSVAELALATVAATRADGRLLDQYVSLCLAQGWTDKARVGTYATELRVAVYGDVKWARKAEPAIKGDKGAVCTRHASHKGAEVGCNWVTTAYAATLLHNAASKMIKRAIDAINGEDDSTPAVKPNNMLTAKGVLALSKLDIDADLFATIADAAPELAALLTEAAERGAADSGE